MKSSTPPPVPPRPSMKVAYERNLDNVFFVMGVNTILGLVFMFGFVLGKVT